MTENDPCPVCGKPRGFLMETHHDMPGLLERLRGVNGQADRWVLTTMLTVLAALNLAAADALLHIF
jgi:hypothetical protein